VSIQIKIQHIRSTWRVKGCSVCVRDGVGDTVILVSPSNQDFCCQYSAVKHMKSQALDDLFPKTQTPAHIDWQILHCEPERPLPPPSHHDLVGVSDHLYFIEQTDRAGGSQYNDSDRRTE
jgi:hypothetical protein